MTSRFFLWPVLLLAFASLQRTEAESVDVYSRPRQLQKASEYDVLHYRIQLRLDDATRSFDGETQITLEPLIDGFDICVLDAEAFTVSAVKGEKNATLRFEQTPGTLTVHLPKPYRYREKLSFTVIYRATNVAPDPEHYGMPKGYGLGLGFKAESPSHPRLINTLSFPEGARHWFPCHDHPSDKATNEVIATISAPNQVISNGRLVGVSENRARGEKTFHWSQDLPHSTYLFVLVAGPYVKIADSLGPLQINYWVYAKDAPDARRSFRKTPEAIAFFNREFGYRFPWAKYDQITIPDFGGGAESTSATVIGDNVIHDEKADKDFPSHWLIAHEAAHQWWGNLVTMRDWSQTWLNESFATYSEYLFAKHTQGEDEAALNLRGKIEQYLTESREKYKRPIVFDRWNVPNDNFDRHTYQKGAVVLSMLRWVMGDEPFRRALASYLKKHAFQSVDTHDFEVAIRESTGQSLDWFFEEWIYQAGHPVLDIGYTWSAEIGKVSLRVVQKQAVPGRIPLFRMPVQIGITTAAGKRSHRIWLSQREETFDLDSQEKPLLVRFDDGNHLLKEVSFPKSSEELMYQLAHDDMIGRMDAAAELGRHANGSGSPAALQRASREDAFWAVRRAAILALGSSADVTFIEQRSTDPVSAVRVAALRVLGNRKDGSLVPFFEGRFQAEDSYLAQAEALRSIGKTGVRSSVAFVQSAGALKSPGNVIHAAAEAALREMER